MVKTLFHDAPRLLVSMLFGIPAIIFGTIAVTCKFIALALAHVADQALSTIQERKDERPTADKVDPS